MPSGPRPEDTLLEGARSSRGAPVHRASRFRHRWFSRRALLLHLTVIIVAPGCGLAGWWQADRALSGNGLSWVYSVEWPLFGVVAVAAWWQLVHEAPEAYRARKQRSTDGPSSASVHVTDAHGPAVPVVEAPIEPGVARLSTLLVAFVSFEFLLGFVAVFFVPVNRPSGWLPTSGKAIYLLHAAFGAVVAGAAVVLVVRTRSCGRAARVISWLGLTGVALAGGGGMLTVAQSLVRFLGLALMFLGPSLSVFSYAAPLMLKHGKSPFGPPAPDAP
jgi:hypothetical protein